MKPQENWNAQFPQILHLKMGMTHPNNDIIVDKGTFYLTWENDRYELEGKILFKWLPDLRVRFNGTLIKPFNNSIFAFFKSNFRIEIENADRSFKCSGFLLGLTSKEPNQISLYLKPPITFGDLKIKVGQVRFDIPNLRYFYGQPVRNKKSAYRNRLLFENKEYLITLDQSTSFSKKNQELKERGGFILLYAGKLEPRNKREVSYEEALNVLDSFSYFLQFINGKRTHPLFIKGIDKRKNIWESYTPYIIDRYKYVNSWPPEHSTEGLSDLWESFCNLWSNESDRECLKTVLHWYVEANLNSAYSEGSIVLIQNALELLFHWFIAEKKRYVNQSDADNISASVKIGFLLSSLQIMPDIPIEFVGLIEYAKKYSITNGPEVFIKIRNCIVHPSLKKRKTLKELEGRAIFEARELGIWYVEIILLKLMNYNGEYQNRCKLYKGISSTEKIEKV